MEPRREQGEVQATGSPGAGVARGVAQGVSSGVSSGGGGDGPRGSLRGVTLGVTLGDPGGIGPECVVRALAPGGAPGGAVGGGVGGASAARAGVRFVVFGSAAAMHRAAQVCGIEPFWWQVDRGSDLVGTAGAGGGVVLVDSDRWAAREGLAAAGGAGGGGMRPFEAEPTRAGGELSFRWVEDAIAAAKRAPGDPERVDGVVTGPISKAAWDLAGHGKFPGHTELFAARFGVKRFAMMFEGPSLRVVLATVHIPLMDVRNVLTIGRVHAAIELGALGCQRLGVPRPRIAVCGLNPHAGEGGLLGDEEERLIVPAIRVAREQGHDVHGPFPGDTVFNAAVAGRYDLVVAMYHDQGLIPVKLLARDRSVNITVGLPTVRTSPDHGTAFDIAGRGIADAGSTAAAIDAAVRLLDGANAAAAAAAGRG